MDEDKKIPFLKYREVEKLPDEAIEDEIILNKEDGCFYMGINIGEVKNGSRMEETSVST